MTSLNIARILRTCLAIVAIVLVLLAWSAEINAAMSATLRHNPTVEGDNVVLGDIFDGLTEDAEYALAPAPKPGEELTWSAHTLMRISNAFNLQWRPSSAMDQITIRRAGTLLTHKDIEEPILHRLYAQENITDTAELSFDNLSEIVLPHGTSPILMVDSLYYDELSRVFSATLVAATSRTYSVTGQLHKVIPVPVLKTVLRRDDIIGAYDIDWVNARENQIRNNVIVQADDLVGMTPRRSIEPGKPIKMADLAYPKIVKRGEPVSIVYNNGRISVTAQGRALENGAKGNLVTVSNNSSNRTLQAVVTGVREVSVQ